VLAKGGQFIFTDPMQSASCPKDVLQPILNRTVVIFPGRIHRG